MLRVGPRFGRVEPRRRPHRPKRSPDSPLASRTRLPAWPRGTSRSALTKWPPPLLLFHVVPVLWVEAERRGLGGGALQVAGDLGDEVGGVYLPFHRELLRQVVLP